jgi:hypothetical protein
MLLSYRPFRWWLSAVVYRITASRAVASAHPVSVMLVVVGGAQKFEGSRNLRALSARTGFVARAPSAAAKTASPAIIVTTPSTSSAPVAASTTPLHLQQHHKSHPDDPSNTYIALTMPSELW